MNASVCFSQTSSSRQYRSSSPLPLLSPFLSHARRVPAPAPTACSGGPDYNGLPQNSQYNSIAVFSLASSSGHPSLRQLSVIASITVCQNRSSFQMSNFIASSIPRAGGGARGGLGLG
jgi:hypothetical protein